LKIGILQGGGSVQPNYHIEGKGTYAPIIFMRMDRPTNALQTVADSFHRRKLCSRLNSSKVPF